MVLERLPLEHHVAVDLVGDHLHATPPPLLITIMEIMRPGNDENLGKSQSVLMMIARWMRARAPEMGAAISCDARAGSCAPGQATSGWQWVQTPRHGDPITPLRHSPAARTPPRAPGERNGRAGRVVGSVERAGEATGFVS
jgi:hypothetical protein